MIDPRTDCHCHILPGMDDLQGTDLHNMQYAEFFDSFGFKI